MRLRVLLGHARRRRLEQRRLVSMHNATSSSSCNMFRSSLLGVQPVVAISQGGDLDGESMVVDGAGGSMAVNGDGSARVGGVRLVEPVAIGLVDGGSTDGGSLFVEGISDAVNYAQIKALFTRWGTVRSVYVQQRRKPGRRTRFGFVHMVSEVDACKAKAMLDGWRICGSSLSVSAAKVSHPKRGVVHCAFNSMIEGVRVASSRNGLEHQCDDGVADEVTCLIGDDVTGCDHTDGIDDAMRVVGSRLDNDCVSSSACVSLREGSRGTPFICVVGGHGLTYHIFVDGVLKFVRTKDKVCTSDEMNWSADCAEVIGAIARNFEMKMHALWFPQDYAPSIASVGPEGVVSSSDFVVRDDGTTESEADGAIMPDADRLYGDSVVPIVPPHQHAVLSLIPLEVVFSRFNVLTREEQPAGTRVSDVDVDMVEPIPSGGSGRRGRGRPRIMYKGRGRPKKKNDLQVLIAEDSDMTDVLESLVDVEERVLPVTEQNHGCVFERARGMLETGKFRGLVFSGTDEEALKASVEYLRATHPRKYEVSGSMR